MDHTSVNQIIVDVMVVFMLLGAFDRCIGNKLRLGTLFESGFGAMKPLTLNMVGIVCIAPVLGRVLTPIVGPVYQLLGADPAMFAGTLLANDMGGLPLAMEMAQTPEAGVFGGLFLGATLGANIVFIIPVGLSMIEKDDAPAFATGILCSIIAVPIGPFVAGLVAGYPVVMMLRNLVPVIIVSLLVALGLWRIPGKMITGFRIFGRFTTILATACLALGILETLTGVALIPGMAPITDGLEIVGSIVIVLAGAFVMMDCVSRIFNKPLSYLGKKMGLDGTTLVGMLASMANTTAMYPMVARMSERGKVVCIAFSSAVAGVFGDHLGFTTATLPNMVAPMILCKLAYAATALAIAMALSSPRFVGRRKKRHVTQKKALR